MFFSEKENRDFLKLIKNTLPKRVPPKNIKIILKNLMEEEKADIPELNSFKTKKLGKNLSGLIERKIKIQKRKWAATSIAGYSFSTLFVFSLSISYFGWGYVRDSFRAGEQIEISLDRVERASKTGLSGNISDLNSLLTEDPFLS
tara:strand:- start:737 stop:1171 length:435 start_codon:yes stop_codon:yes gene_type:complete